MPHSAIKLIPGVDQNETSAMNEGGVSNSNLIRYVYDKRLGGLIQKLGGWTKYVSRQFDSVIRALWAWEDNNASLWLAVGNAGLNVIKEGVITDITPTFFETDVNPVSVATTAGSSTVTITDATFSTSSYDSVFIETQISVGGLLIYGYYDVEFLSSSAYTIQASDILGFPAAAAYTTVTAPITITGISSATGSAVTYTFASVGYTFTTDSFVIISGLNPSQFNGVYKVTGATTTSVTVASTATGSWVSGGTVNNRGVLPQFTSTNGSSTISVVLPNHGLIEGGNFVVGVASSVGGIVLYGNYTVIAVSTTDPLNAFTIVATNTATSSDVEYMNGGSARFYYAIGIGPPTSGSGYSSGGYGMGGYGTGVSATPSSGPPVVATDWTMDNWGQILISCPVGGAIYGWDPTSNSPTATMLPQSPFVNDGMFLAMPQRQIIAWGSSFNSIQDPLLVRWCDIGNFRVWVAFNTNQAGSYRIPRGSRIVGGIQGPQQGLIWTDLAVWSMQYVNQPLVYSFNEIGTGCGLISRKAAVSMGGIVYWMGQSQFFSLSGDGVQPMPCTVLDFVFQQLDRSNVDNIRSAPNTRFNEVSWYFPTTTSNGEVVAYVKYNTLLRLWDCGYLARSAWINESVLGPPMGASPEGYIYQHETGNDDDGQPMLSSFQTGYFALGEGEDKVFIDQIWPDMKWGYTAGFDGGEQTFQSPTATLSITFWVTDYPNKPPTQYGPFTMTEAINFITPRIRGRLVSIEVSSADLGTWWRIGNIRYRYKPDGKM
jgi:hypothetical protein